jgi:YihY family inner membrane protein
MMSAVGAVFLLALSIGPAMSLIRAWQGPVLGWQPLARPGIDRLLGWLSALAPVLFSVFAFMLLYRTTPRTRVTWGDVWLGGLVAALIWEAGKQIFTWYLSNIATYNVIYGSVGAVIAFLLWCYLSAQILLLGAEFTVVNSRWRRAGRPIETRPLAEWMADRSSLKVFEEGE